ELSVNLRNQTVARHRSGQGYKTITKTLKVLRTTVASIILKWKKLGTILNLSSVGHPAKLGIQERRVLIREVRKNPTVTLKELQKACAEMGEPVGWISISAGLYKSGLHGRGARQEPLLSKRDTKAQRNLATCGKRFS
ncbi:hypothetical protein PDJAM_G00107950, partial [Pangasius djambal]|nr:hypothetical protein [Pangasius djambal]